MPKTARYIAYFFLFVVSFVVFLYLNLPYDAIKERIIGMIEKETGGKYFVLVEELSPYWFTGVELKGLSLSDASGDDRTELISLQRIRSRVSFFSLLFGSPSVSFDVSVGKGGIFGKVGQSADFFDLNLKFDDLDLKNLKIIGSKIGVEIASRIDGSIKMKIDKRNPIRSEGSVSLDLDNINIAETELKLGEMTMPIPTLVLSKNKGSEIKADVDKGTINVKNFKLAEGDLQLDLNGKIFLSNNVSNYRFNLNGSFKVSENLEKALPFLFIVDKQKNEDGSFPLSITGRMAKPSIKIGSFTLPI
jgi:type II secretion system protein N